MELAQANTEQFLWIDAICINQKDIEERNQQVAIMEQIYSTAEEVTIWLGQSDPASDEAMTLLERLNYDGSESQENIISKLIGKSHPDLTYLAFKSNINKMVRSMAHTATYRMGL